MEYYEAIKIEILPFATWMDLENIMLSEMSQSEKDKYNNFTYMWNLRNKTKKRQKEKKTKQTQTPQYREQRVVCQEGWVKLVKGIKRTLTVMKTGGVLNC